MKDLYLIGGGGHCRSVIDVIELESKYRIKGIFDVKENIGKDVLGYKIIGSDEDVAKYASSENYFLITVGQIKSAEIRIKIYKKLKEIKANLATVISPRAHVSRHASVGEGTVILHDALVNANAKVGNNCIINTKSLIEHDATVEDHCHISTAAVVNGNCYIESETFIGSNAVLKEGLVVVSKSIIPAGSFYRGK